jgi:hypothetical protein
MAQQRHTKDEERQPGKRAGDTEQAHSERAAPRS